MRASSRHPEQITIDKAVRAALNALRSSGHVSRETAPVEPPISVTTPGLDAGGNVITLHDFMLGVDALNDPAAQLQVRGTPPNYLT